MTVVVCETYQHFTYWCSIQDPPVDPRSRDVFKLSTVEDCHRFRGRRRQEGDELVYYTWPRSINWIDSEAIYDAIRIWEL